MKTFYIPVHFHEQQSVNDDLVKVVTQNDISDDDFNIKLHTVAEKLICQKGEQQSSVKLANEILDTVAIETGGIWSYCKTIPLTIVDSPESDKTKKEMKAVSYKELAALLIKLEVGETLHFYENYDKETGTTDGIYGATLLSYFESLVILINYYGGGMPWIMDITSYDESDLEGIQDSVYNYFNELGCARKGVFIGANIKTENI